MDTEQITEQAGLCILRGYEWSDVIAELEWMQDGTAPTTVRMERIEQAVITAWGAEEYWEADCEIAVPLSLEDAASVDDIQTRQEFWPSRLTNGPGASRSINLTPSTNANQQQSDRTPFTMSGQAWDWVLQQIGMGRDATTYDLLLEVQEQLGDLYWEQEGELSAYVPDPLVCTVRSLMIAS